MVAGVSASLCDGGGSAESRHCSPPPPRAASGVFLPLSGCLDARSTLVGSVPGDHRGSDPPFVRVFYVASSFLLSVSERYKKMGGVKGKKELEGTKLIQFVVKELG